MLATKNEEPEEDDATRQPITRSVWDDFQRLSYSGALEHIKSEPIAFSSHPVSVAPSGDLITFRLLTRRSKTVLVVLRVSFTRTPSR